MKRTKLTPKQERFVEEYLVDANATAAAKRAGYSARNADKIGPELLGKTRVAAAIDALKAQRSETTGIDATFVLLQLIEIVKADVSDIISDDGEFKPISEWPAPWPQMCSSLEIEPIYERSTDGKDRAWDLVGHKTKARFERGNKALEMLGKHTDVRAWVMEKVDLSINVNLTERLEAAVKRVRNEHNATVPASVH